MLINYTYEKAVKVFTSSDPWPVKNKITNEKKRWCSFIANPLINVGEIYPRCTKKKTTKFPKFGRD